MTRLLTLGRFRRRLRLH